MGRETTKEEWAELRTAQGRATAADWRESAPLLAYQAEISRTCARHAVTFVEKSRRTGATYGAAADAVIRSGSAREAGGMDTLYMGTSADMAREFVDACGFWARLLGRAVKATGEMLFDDGSEKGIKATRIDFRSGYSIVALPSTPRALRGRQGFVVIDEAAFVDDLGEVLKSAIALTMWGGKILVISTHNGAANPFALTIDDIRAERVPYGLVRFDLDQALKAGLYERICLVSQGRKTWSPVAEAEWRDELLGIYRDNADEELYVIPSQGSGTWLSAALIEARMAPAPVLRLAKPPAFTFLSEPIRRAEVQAWIDEVLVPAMDETLDDTLMSAFGADFGRYRDISSFWPLQITRTLRRVTPFVVELAGVPFQQQEQIRDAILDRLPRLVGGMIDATGIGASFGESAAQRYGPSMVAVKFGPEWYRTEMPPLKAAFEDDAIVVPRDSEILGDFRVVKVVHGVAQVPALRQGSASGGRRHGESAISCALAYAASRMTVEAYAYEGARRGSGDEGERWWRQGSLSDLEGGRRDGIW